MVVTNYFMPPGFWTQTGPSEHYLRYCELCEGYVVIAITAPVLYLWRKEWGKTLTWTLFYIYHFLSDTPFGRNKPRYAGRQTDRQTEV
jgi:hypothetical protein